MTYESERLIIRPMILEDVEPFSQINQDSKVMEFFPSLLSYEQSEDFVKNILAHQNDKGYSLNSLILKDTGEWIGFCGLWTVGFTAEFTPAVEIGWRLGSQYFKKGYGSEAASLVLQTAFEEHHLPKVVSFTALQNIPSIRLMEKIGLKRTGVFRHPRLPSDHWLSEHVYYQMTKQQWAERKS
ncbi:MAG: GNAT family N-acetyltransferase [Legionellales bacterium]|nr:GNAT family N-acetyltransferase [Legionellales bacterium]|tara:strand:- start:770 stop:1318 length:549 start_codon:yes stop_codon:yes gene_type:complete